MGLQILVITNDGEVWGHDVDVTTKGEYDVLAPAIGPTFRLDGPPVAANPGDQSVLTMGTRILVVTKEGDFWGHDLNDTTIGQALKF